QLESELLKRCKEGFDPRELEAFIKARHDKQVQFKLLAAVARADDMIPRGQSCQIAAAGMLSEIFISAHDRIYLTTEEYSSLNRIMKDVWQQSSSPNVLRHIASAFAKTGSNVPELLGRYYRNKAPVAPLR